MEDFIRAELRIRTLGTASQKSPRTVLLVRGQSSYIRFWDTGLYVKRRIIDGLHNLASSGSWVIIARYKIKRECYLFRSCLLGARRILFFMVKQVFLLMGKIWSVHWYNADTQCTIEGKEEAKGQKKNFFMFKFFLSCHKIWLLFHRVNIKASF